MLICENIRRLLVHQVLRTMDLGFFEDEHGCIVDDDGRWAIYLPDDDMSVILIAFNQDVDPACAADFSMRFCKLPDLAGLNIVVESSFESANSTGSTTAETVH